MFPTDHCKENNAECSELGNSVMQSEWNRFCGDVVLDSFYKASRNEDNIIDQLYKNKYAGTNIVKNFILDNILRKCIHNSSTKTEF